MSCCNSNVNGLIPNDINSLSNTGSGTQLLIEDTVYGDDLIKTITGGGGITIVDNGVLGIEINGTGLGGVQSVDNEGSGHFLVDNTDPVNPKIKSIITGDGISMVNNGDDETISTNINYTSLDTNGKLDVYGLTQDFTDANSAKLIIGTAPSTFNYINNANVNSMTESTLGWVTNSEYQIVDRVSLLSNTSEITITPTLIDLQTNGSVNLQPDIEFKSEVVVTPGTIYTEIDQTTTLIGQTVSNSTTNLSKTIQIPDSYTAKVGDPLDDYSELEIIPTKIELRNNFGGTDRSFRIDQGFSYLTGLPTFSDAVVSIDQGTGLLGITSGSTVNSLSLVGNPVHAFVNTTGNLDYRGMISPDGTVNFNVTPTNIEITSPNQTVTLTGDVTGSGTGSFATTISNNAVTSAAIATNAVTSTKIGTSAVTSTKIANSNVTYAKIQNVTASSLLGNPTGSSAAPSEITLGTNLSFAGSVLNAAGGSGVTTINVQNFSGGYTYTPTVGMKFCQVVAQGGGGGGGGCRAGAAGTSGASAGGSSGATVLGFYNAITIGASKSGIVGNGGAGGLGISGGAGSDGSDTTFGALITAAKGRGGAGATASSSFTSTAYTSTFGTSTGGSAILQGNYGLAGHAHGSSLAPIAGAGGASPYFGDGGFGFGSTTGAGGGGVSTSGAVADVDGFAGKSGRLFVIEYI